MISFRKILVFALAVLALGASGAALIEGGSGGLFHRPAAAAAVSEPDEVSCLGYVDIEHGVAALDALRPGRVEAVLVKENEHVAAGAVLVRLEDRVARSRLEEASAALEIARLALEQTRRRPDEHRLRLAQQAAALKAAEDRLASARPTLAYHRKLVAKELEAPERAAEAEGRVAELEALVRAEAHRLSELKLQDPGADVRRAEAEVSLQAARMRQAEAELKELTLTAPQAGRVLRILASRGQLVGGSGHQPVVQFCPEAPRLVRVELEQEFAGAVRPGQAAVISDDFAGGASWRGRVRRLAEWYGPQRAVLDEPRPERGVRTVECVIEVEDGSCPLRIGQRVRVRVVPVGRSEAVRNTVSPN